MHPEIIAIHSGFDADPATKAVAVPVCQTAAYAYGRAVDLDQALAAASASRGGTAGLRTRRAM